MSEPRPLRERKRQRTRDRIIDTAFELFAERGFAGVTVEDIAERAEVGRTTFFRYFGDKQEVLFADADLIDPLLARMPDLHGAGLPAVLEELRGVVLGLCEALTGDAELFAAYTAVVEATPELQDRERRKHGLYVTAMRTALVDRGVDGPTATLAPQVALACYQAARTLAGADPGRLIAAVDSAFDALQSPPSDSNR